MRRPVFATCFAAVIGACFAVALPPTADAAASRPDAASPSLTGQATPDPWGIRFYDGEGRTILSQPSADQAGAAGNLGFKTATGWARATRATDVQASNGGLTATVLTDDPLGRTFKVQILPAGPGSVRVSATVSNAVGVQATSIAFTAAPDERFLGLGSRSTAVDHQGTSVENYVADGPYPERARPIVDAASLPWATRPRDDATYYPVPWVLSSRGYGVLVENNETSVFHLGSDRADVWSIEAESASLTVRVFGGPRPADALRNFTAATGRQPPSQAPWGYGPWFQTGQPNVVPVADERRWADLLRAGDAPVSVGETQMHYLPCGVHRRDPETEAARTANFHSRGMARLVYFNPLLCTDYEPVYSRAAAAGGLQGSPTGGPFTYPAYVGGDGPAGFTYKPLAQFDFTSEAGRKIYKELLEEAVGNGVDGWMEDFGEFTPPNATSADGTPGTQMHNLYPTTYHCLVREFQDERRGADPGARPLVRFSRSGWTGTARCADNVWGGDPTTVWDFDGLSSAVMQGLGMGASGVSRWGSDIGGYHTFGPDQKLSPELLARWIEFGAVSAVMRTKASGLELPSYKRPQIWEPESIGIWRRYAKLHTQLNPYIRAADATYRRTGMPIMRHGLLGNPGDPRAAALEDQFMFGPALLAAPVLEPGARERSLYAPKGRWLDFWKALRFTRRAGAYRMRRPRLLSGGREMKVDAPLNRLPMLIRAGSLIPLLSADIDTLAPYGKESGLVHLRDRARRMRILAFPRGRSSAGINERERLVSRESRGGARGWTMRIDGKRRRRYSIEAALSTLRRPFKPRSVKVDGRSLAPKAWRYNAKTRVLRVGVRCRDCRISVR